MTITEFREQLATVNKTQFYKAALAAFEEAAEDMTPACRENKEAMLVFSSPYLTNFSAKEYRSDHPEIDAVLSSKVDEKSKRQVKAYQQAEKAVEDARANHKANEPYAQAEARRRCNACPIKDKCDTLAMASLALDDSDERTIYGMIAGVSERERRNVLREANKRALTVFEVWPEDFNNAPELRDPLRDLEEKINKFIK